MAAEDIRDGSQGGEESPPSVAVRPFLSRLSLRLYDLFLRAYPRSYRRRFADGMRRTFTELCDEELTGFLSALAIWLRELPSLLRRGLAERLGSGGGRRGNRGPGRDMMAAEGGWLGGLRQDVKHTLRMLQRRPVFATVVILTLMLGIGMNVAIFSILHGVLLKPLPFQEPERLVRVGRASPDSIRWLNPISASEYRDLAPRLDLIDELAALSPSGAVLTDLEEPAFVRGGLVSVNLFDMLGARPQLGRFFGEGDAEPTGERVVVLADTFWRDRLGADPDVVGSTVELGGEPYTVIGVAPRGFEFRSGSGLSGSEYWEPLQWTERALASRHSHSLLLYGRLAPGASVQAAAEELHTVWRGVVEDDPGNHFDEAYEAGMTAVPLRQFTVASTREPLLFLAGAVALILAIACVNVANLLLANTDSRQHELAVRAALGAGRGRLLRQFLTEALLVTGVGGALGIWVAHVAVGGILSAFPGVIPRAEGIGLDLPVLAFALGISMLTAVLLGLVASLQSRLDGSALKERSGGSGRASTLRRGMVVAEIALALILVVGAGLMIKSFWNIQSVDVGFESDNLLAVNMTLASEDYRGEGYREAYGAFYGALMERLEASPEIESAAMTSMVPVRNFGRNISGVAAVGRPDRRAQYVEVHQVTPGYHETLGVPLIRGRGFTRADTEAETPGILINERLARQLFDEESPVGQRLNLEPPIEILGVVADIRAAGPDREVDPAIYVPTAYAGVLLVRANRDVQAAVAELRSVARELEPGARIYRVETLDSIIEGSLGDRRFQLLLVSLFAGVALVLGAIGVYGVMSYLIQGRMRDYGIRLAIGARARDIRLQVLGRAGTLAVIGLGIGLAGAYALRRFIADLLFGVDPADPSVYAAVTLSMAAVAGLACWFPARRASTADPVATLRDE